MHGGIQFTSWWEQIINHNIPLQENGLSNLSENDTLTLAYVRLEDIEKVKLRKSLLKQLGGKNHVKCGEHHIPLISSTKISNKCQCGRQEYLRCCAFD